MKYLCAIYIDEQKLNGMSADEYTGMARACLEYEDDVRTNGKLLAAEALEPIHTATTVRVRDGKSSVTDGPFAETKEQLAGFFLVDAADLNDAVNIASGMPQARIGSIEVRPLKDLAQHLQS
jgi:hypothetical protein